MMLKPNKVWLSILCIFVFISMMGCSEGLPVGKYPLAGETETWKIEVFNFEIAEDLSTTASALLYSGDIALIDFHEEPTHGNTFLLIELSIEKKNPGPSVFEWARLTIEDESGATFYRHPNDTFLEVYNFPRIKSTDLTFGKHDGFICFEIPVSSKAGSLNLVYGSDDGTINLNLQ
jgi:hypothetical protein